MASRAVADGAAHVVAMGQQPHRHAGSARGGGVDGRVAHEQGADFHEVIPIGITLDERIADGYYYSGTVALVKELLTHPELLEAPADTPVEYAIKR